MNKKYVLGLLSILLLVSIFLSSTFTLFSPNDNPLDKILIKSNFLYSRYDKTDKKIEIFYKDDVSIFLGDDSQITCKKLNVIINIEDKIIEFIELTDSVNYKNQDKYISCDNMIIDLKSETCNLNGNIEVKQRSNKKENFPVVSRGDSAILNLRNKHIIFSGQSNRPTETIITLN